MGCDDPGATPGGIEIEARAAKSMRRGIRVAVEERVGERFRAEPLTGLLLAGGGLLGAILLAPTALISQAIWTVPSEAALRLVADHRLVWQAANAGFAVATVMTAAGLTLLPDAIGEPGRPLARAGAAGYGLASGLWLLALLIRMTITPGVATAFAATGTVDPAFAAIAQIATTGYLGLIYVGGASLVVIGGAMIPGSSTFARLGWATALVGIGFTGGYVVLGDMLPAVIYVPTTVIGIALLRRTR